MADRRVFTTDRGVTSFDIDNSDGNVDWDQVDVVTIQNAPYEDRFSTDTFYRIPTTVTRSMKQPYLRGGDLVTLKKDADELQKAAWSLDNRPFTIGHPDTPTGAVDSQTDVHGFVRNPEFDEDEAVQRADTFIPTNDEVAMEAIEDGMDDVSPGFRNTEIPADDDDEVDGYQTDIMYDHLAAVDDGRCSRENGCGLTADSAHGHVIDFTVEVETDQPAGIHDVDGEWFAVGPDEHTKDSTDHPDDAMYPVGGCADVKDAWRLRNHGEDLTISHDTLADRIQRAAEAHGCKLPTEQDSQTMCDSDTDCDCGDGQMLSVDNLSLDAIAARHDGVAEVIEDKNELEEKLSEKEEQLEATKETVQDLKEDLSEYREEEKRSVVDEIVDLTDTWDEDTLMEKDLDTLEDRLTLAQDLAADVKEPGVTGDSSDSSEQTESTDGTYEPGQTYDLSDNL